MLSTIAVKHFSELKVTADRFQVNKGHNVLELEMHTLSQFSEFSCET